MIISKKPPYAGTKVDPDRTRLEIEKLLRDYGVSSVQFRTDYRLNQVELQFTVEVERNGVKRGIGFKVNPPTFADKRRSWDPAKGYVTVYAPNWSQSMRMLYYWLKSKLEAVAYGFSSVENEFLSQAVVQLRDGTITTYGAALETALRSGTLTLEAPKPEKERNPNEVLEATVSEVEQIVEERGSDLSASTTTTEDETKK